MMAGFFNVDNKFWSTISSAVDAVALNLIWLFTCIPIITLGAATTAFYYTTHKVIRNQRSGIWKEYWSSFRSNFKQATKTWLIFLAVFIMLSLDMWICREYLKVGETIGIMAYFFLGLTALALLWFIYVFAYIARFEDNIKTTLKNASIMILSHPCHSLLVMVIMVAVVYICSVYIMFNCFVPAIAMVILNAIMEKVFRKYMTEEELREEQENDVMRR